MSDYKHTIAFRIKPFESFNRLLRTLNVFEEYNKIKNYEWCDTDREALLELNYEVLNDKNLRIIYYKDELYVDILYKNDWVDGDFSFYMSTDDVKEIVDKTGIQYVGVITIIAHSWYDGCDEPYTY